MNFTRILFGICAVIGGLQSAMLVLGKQNMGNFLVYGLTLFSGAYAVWYDKINRLCKKGIWKWMQYFIFAFILVLTMAAAFVALNGRKTTVTGQEKAMIVLGAGLKGRSPNGMLAKRLDAAYETWKQYPQMQIVVSGGQGKDEIISEAQAMAEYLYQKGVPTDKVWLEDKSTNTWENFSFSKKILEQNGISEEDSIAFATSDFHCWRAKWTAKQIGFSNVSVIPAPTPISRLLPSWLREGGGVLYYTLIYH